MLQHTKLCLLGNKRALVFRYPFSCLFHLFAFDGCIFDKSTESKTGWFTQGAKGAGGQARLLHSRIYKQATAKCCSELLKRVSTLYQEQHSCIAVQIPPLSAAGNKWSAAPEMQEPKLQQSQSYSSIPLQKHPNLCSCELYALELTPRDTTTSDSTDAQQSMDFCSLD